MKKIFSLVLFAGLICSGFAAEFVFPGWKCTDEAKLTAALDNAKGTWEKTVVMILQRINSEKVATYEALCTQIDAVIDTADFGSEAARESMRVTYKKQFPLCRGEYIAEAWAFCLKNPTSYDFYYYRSHAATLKFTDTQVYNAVLSCLLSYNYSAKETLGAVNQLLDKAVLADVTTQKADLQKLNRKFSPKLIADKAAWEPVVAAIRTAIETY